MESQQAASGFPEIRVPAALTFAALVLGFVAGTVLRGTNIEAAVLDRSRADRRKFRRLTEKEVGQIVK